MEKHPVAALFPPLTGAEFDAFVEDIRTHGLITPIKTWRGLLIDGINREKACKAAGVEPRYEEVDLPDEFAVIEHIVSANLHRRNLDAGQRATIGETMRPQLAAAAKARQEAGLRKGRELGAKVRHGDEVISGADISPTGGRVNDQLATILNVAASTMKQAHKVTKDAPELAAKVLSGEMKLGAAYKTVTGRKHIARKSKQPPQKTDDALSRAEAGLAATFAKLAELEDRGAREITDFMTQFLSPEQRLEVCAAFGYFPTADAARARRGLPEPG